jgi:hypothetical protein
VGLILTLVGALLLLLALFGVALGLFMATDRHSRTSGLFFALWWVPGVAAAAGVLMRDPVTSLVGLFCFVVAGLVLVLDRRVGGETPAKPRGKKMQSLPSFSTGAFSKRKRQVSERAKAREERARRYGRAAS